MSSVEKHVLLEMAINGDEKVAFVTDFGWANMAALSIDAVSLEQAKTSAIDFVKSMNPVPYENCCGNEQFPEEAEKAMDVIIGSIADITELVESFEVNCIYPMKLKIKFTPSYEVNFG